MASLGCMNLICRGCVGRFASSGADWVRGPCSATSGSASWGALPPCGAYVGAVPFHGLDRKHNGMAERSATAQLERYQSLRAQLRLYFSLPRPRRPIDHARTHATQAKPTGKSRKVLRRNDKNAGRQNALRRAASAKDAARSMWWPAIFVSEQLSVSKSQTSERAATSFFAPYCSFCRLLGSIKDPSLTGANAGSTRIRQLCLRPRSRSQYYGNMWIPPSVLLES